MSSFAIVLVLLGSVSTVAPRPLQAADTGSGRYPPQEQAILELLDRVPAARNDERLAALDQLRDAPAFASPRAQALLTWQQCVLAAHAGDDTAAFEQRLARQQQKVPAEAAIPVFIRFCTLTRDFRNGEDRNAFESWRDTFADTEMLGLPLLRYEAASAYAQQALATGMVDQALTATEVALQIARRNEDEPYQRDSLMSLALIQADMGEHEAALRNSAAALELAGGDERIDLLLNRGYILLRAKQAAPAIAIYERVRQLARQQDAPENELSAVLNLIDAHSLRNDREQMLQLSAQALEMARRLDRDYYLGYALVVRAFALVDNQRGAEASTLFEQGIALKQKNGEQSHVITDLALWAQRLATHGRYEEAYRALARSVQLQAESRAAEHQRNAQQLSAVLDAGQKDVAIERLRRQNEVARLEMEKRRLGTAAWSIGLAALAVIALLLLLSYLRLRRASRLLARTNARLDHENAHDPLTRLHNRAYFIRSFAERMNHNDGHPAMLALIDLDHFKSINDRFGHAVGDQVLRETARRLAAALRESDIIARWGGEEFVVLAPQLGQGRRAGDIAERLRKALADTPFTLDNGEYTVTASIGYVEFHPQPEVTLDAELETADTCLYRAKHTGRNRVNGIALETRDHG